MAGEITRGTLGCQRNSAGKRIRKRFGTAALGTRPPLTFVGILALQQLVGGDDPHTLHFLADRDPQLLKEGPHFLGGTAARSGSRYPGAELADSVIQSARRHTGRAQWQPLIVPEFP